MMQVIRVLVFLFFMFGLSNGSDPILVDTIDGDHEDLCSLYPTCREYGPGLHQVLEDCSRYFECILKDDETYLQKNWQCPEELLFSRQDNRCVDSKLEECESFQNLKCFYECPRIMFTSPDPALDKKTIGCFRYFDYYEQVVMLILFILD